MVFFSSPVSGLVNLNDDKSVIESVQSMLQPDIERRLAAKKRLDDIAVSTLLENVTLLKSAQELDEKNSSNGDRGSLHQQHQQPQPSSSSSKKAE